MQQDLGPSSGSSRCLQNQETCAGPVAPHAPSKGPRTLEEAGALNFVQPLQNQSPLTLSKILRVRYSILYRFCIRHVFRGGCLDFVYNLIFDADVWAHWLWSAVLILYVTVFGKVEGGDLDFVVAES